MTAHIPDKLKPGDEIRVLALSRSIGGIMQLSGVTEADVEFSVARLQAFGLRVTFGRWARECNVHLTASPQHRLEDLHEAIHDPSVKGILAVVGGMGATQIVDGIDYDGLRAHPKIICGYSDIGHICNAVLARADLVTYYGPQFTSFMMKRGAEFTMEYFQRCLFSDEPYDLKPSSHWSDDAWIKDQENRNFHDSEGHWAIQDGETEGVIIGGNYFGLNMLQGSKYFPPLKDAILFLEQPANGKATLMELDMGLRALSFQPGFDGVRGIVIGRFAQAGKITKENLRALMADVPAVRGLPIIANCDFGHTMPILTLPVGGRCALKVSADEARIRILKH